MVRRMWLSIAFCAWLVPAVDLRADVVIDWNKQLLSAIRTESVPPPRASRAMAMTHLAIYDAVNSIEDTHSPYVVNLTVSNTTSREAAASQAAHDVLTALFPSQAATFAAALQSSLASVAEGLPKSDGIQVGSQVASTILAMRANDHASDIVSYTPSGLVGDWEPTPDAYAPALLPNWPTVSPFAMTSGSQFRSISGPPSLSSEEYASSLQEVQALGGANSATRTDDQTSIAKFWADGSGTSTPPGHWNRIAQDVAAAKGNTISENARMFALLNVASADAAIACWDNKYAFDVWRPITAIRRADEDGNDTTVADATWTPLLPTPPFPTYTSGHSTFSGAAATVLARFFGSDAVNFTSRSEGFTEPDRSYTSFSQAANEAALSRLYGGIHFTFDNQGGLDAGIHLGNYVADEFFVPIPEPGSTSLFVLGSLATLLPICRRRNERQSEK